MEYGTGALGPGLNVTGSTGSGAINVSWPKAMADLDDILDQSSIVVDVACYATMVAATAADVLDGLACCGLGFGTDMPARGLVASRFVQGRTRSLGATRAGPRLVLRGCTRWGGQLLGAWHHTSHGQLQDFTLHCPSLSCGQRPTSITLFGHYLHITIIIICPTLALQLASEPLLSERQMPTAHRA